MTSTQKEDLTPKTQESNKPESPASTEAQTTSEPKTEGSGAQSGKNCMKNE